jgi:hypothetical protein
VWIILGGVMSSVSRHERFLSETELPQEVMVSGLKFPARYRRVFRRAYQNLGPNERRGVYEGICLLAKDGNGPQLNSKPFPLKRNPLIPRGSMISKARRSKSVRFAWGIEKGVVIFYFVGAHPDIWKSEA